MFTIFFPELNNITIMKAIDRWIGLWCLTPHSTILDFHRAGQFYWLAESGIPGENHRPVANH